jgi:outer membrane protein TolC
MRNPERVLPSVCAVALALISSAPAWGQEAVEIELSLADAARLAFERNLDIRVISFERSIAEEKVTSARGRFEPLLFVGIPGASSINPFPGGAVFGAGSGFGGFGVSSANTPASTVLAGADVSTSKSVAGLFDFQQTLPFGLRYDISYNVGRTDTNSVFQSLNPSWDNTLAISVMQPLLNGRGEEATAVELLLAQANIQVSRAAFRAQVEEVLLQVESAYWELVFAERDLEVKRSSLVLAEEQLGRTLAQVEVGLIAPVEATQAEVQVAVRETDLILARNNLANARDLMRALLRADILPGGWDTALRPTDEPVVDVTRLDAAELVRTALARRAEITSADATVEARSVAVKATRNALQPRLDLLAQLSTNGVGGDLIVRDGFPGDIVEVIPGGLGDALDQMFSLEFVSWRVGLNVTVPIGNSTAVGNYAQATLDHDRSRTELQRLQQQITLEVRRSARGVEAAAEAVQSTSKTRELAEEQLRIEVDRFDVGMSTNFEVLRFQDDLAVSRSQELRARIAYRLATAQLGRATGSLLDKYNIELQGEKTP